jgi:hypothetical protein
MLLSFVLCRVRSVKLGTLLLLVVSQPVWPAVLVLAVLSLRQLAQQQQKQQQQQQPQQQC